MVLPFEVNSSSPGSALPCLADLRGERLPLAWAPERRVCRPPAKRDGASGWSKRLPPPRHAQGWRPRSRAPHSYRLAAPSGSPQQAIDEAGPTAKSTLFQLSAAIRLLPEPGTACRPPDLAARLVLPVTMTAAQHHPLVAPDDLATDPEPAGVQAVPRVRRPPRHRRPHPETAFRPCASPHDHQTASRPDEPQGDPPRHSCRTVAPRNERLRTGDRRDERRGKRRKRQRNATQPDSSHNISRLEAASDGKRPFARAGRIAGDDA